MDQLNQSMLNMLIDIALIASYKHEQRVKKKKKKEKQKPN